MKPRICYIVVSFIAALLGLIPGAQAQFRPGGPNLGGGDRWEQLGCVEVGRRPDFDVIPVGRREGRFKAIMVSVTGGDVRIEDLRVIYGNGQPDRIVVRAEIRDGASTRPLDLQGRERAIERIEIVSQRDDRGRGRRPARLCVAGLSDETPRLGMPNLGIPVPGIPGLPQAGRWEMLGCQQVGLAMDRDVIRVGRREGRFRAIRLEVAGNDVQIESLTVVYGNGERDQLPVRAFVRQGTQTAPLDLRGRERAIERIELIYRAVANHRGVARVCASGLG